MALHEAGRLAFYGGIAHLTDRRAFLRHLSPVRKKRWVVYAKPPFAGPKTVLAYLSRYTHRVAISNSRLLRFDQSCVTFRYKDYRRDCADRQQCMTITADEFIRRFLLPSCPKASTASVTTVCSPAPPAKSHLDHVRQLLGVAPPAAVEAPIEPNGVRPPCPCCGGRMVVIETSSVSAYPVRRRLPRRHPVRRRRDPARPDPARSRSAHACGADAT
jgi:Putative transposase